MLSCIAAVHIEGIVLKGISRTRIDKEYNFEVGNLNPPTYKHLYLKCTGLWEVFQHVSLASSVSSVYLPGTKHTISCFAAPLLTPCCVSALSFGLRPVCRTQKLQQPVSITTA